MMDGRCAYFMACCNGLPSSRVMLNVILSLVPTKKSEVIVCVLSRNKNRQKVRGPVSYPCVKGQPHEDDLLEFYSSS